MNNCKGAADTDEGAVLDRFGQLDRRADFVSKENGLEIQGEQLPFDYSVYMPNPS